MNIDEIKAWIEEGLNLTRLRPQFLRFLRNHLAEDEADYVEDVSVRLPQALQMLKAAIEQCEIEMKYTMMDPENVLKAIERGHAEDLDGEAGRE